MAAVSIGVIGCNAVLGIEEPERGKGQVRLDGRQEGSVYLIGPDGALLLTDEDAGTPEVNFDAGLVSNVHPTDAKVDGDGGRAPRPGNQEAGPSDPPPPGGATLSVTFVASADSSGDPSPFVSTSGTVARTLDGKATQLSLNQTTDAGTRILNLQLLGNLAQGALIPLDDDNFVEYVDPARFGDWSSTQQRPRVGSVTIDTVDERRFSFTLHGVRMGPVFNASGSLSLNGSGTAHLY